MFRIAFGLCLFYAHHSYSARVPNPFPREQHDDRYWFAQWEWVHWLGSHPDVLALLKVATLGAIVLFTIGLLARLSYLSAVFGLTANLIVGLLSSGGHVWTLALLALCCLVVVPWGDALSVDEVIRRLRGRGRSPYQRSKRYGFAIWLPSLALGTAFAAAAYAKMRVSGPEWVLGGAVKYHFVEDALSAPTDWGLWVARHHEVAVLMSLGAVLVESTFFLVIFFKHPALRALFGLLAASLFGGFYVFQGIWWFPWWMLLTVFLPWEQIFHGVARAIPSQAIRALPRRSVPSSVTGDRGLARARGFPPLNLGPIHVLLVLFMVVQQVVISASRVEIEPFFSNYPMYAFTSPSTADFDQTRMWRFSQLSFAVPDGSGGTVDVTDRVKTIRSGQGTLTDVVHFLSTEKRPLSGRDRSRLEAVRDAYAGRYGQSLDKVEIYMDQRGFDWEKGRFDWKVRHVGLGTLDLRSFELTPPSGVTSRGETSPPKESAPVKPGDRSVAQAN